MLISEKVLKMLIEDIQRLVEAPPLDQFGPLPVSSGNDDDQQPYRAPIKNRKRVISTDWNKKLRPKIKKIKGLSSSGMPAGMKIREEDFRNLFEPFPYDVNIFTVQSTDETGLTNDQVDTIFKKLSNTKNFNPTITKRSTDPNIMSDIQFELEKYISHLDSIYQPDNFIRLVRKVSLENSCRVIKKGLENTAKDALNVLNVPMINEPDNIKFPIMSDASLSSLEPNANPLAKHVTDLLSFPDSFKLSDNINYEPTGRQYDEYQGGYESRAMYYGIFVRDSFASIPIENTMHRHYANKNGRSKHAQDYDYIVKRYGKRNYDRSSDDGSFGINVTDQDLTSKEPFQLRHSNQNWINNDDHFHEQLADYFKNIETSLTNHFKHLAARAHTLASIVKPKGVFEDYRKQIQQVLRLNVAYDKFKKDNIPYSVYDYYELEGITEEEAKASPEKYEEIKAIVEKNYNDLKKEIKSYEDKAVEDFKYHVFCKVNGDISTTRSTGGILRDTKANYNDFKNLGANETVGEFGRRENYPALHYPMSGGFYELSPEEKSIIDSLYTDSVLKELKDIYDESIKNSTVSNTEVKNYNDHDIVRRYIKLLINKISFIIESSMYMSSFEKLFGTKYTNSTSDSPYYTVLPSILSSLENCKNAYQNFQNFEAKNKNSLKEINDEIDLQYEYDLDSASNFTSPAGRAPSFVDKESFQKLIKSMNMVNAEGNIETLEDSFNKSIIPVLKQEIYSSFFKERGEVRSGIGNRNDEKVKQFVIKFSKYVTDLDSFLKSYQNILDGLDVDGTPIGDFPEGSTDKRSIPGASLKQTGVDEFRFTLKYKQFQEMFPFMKDAAIENGITIIYFMTKDTSMSFTPEETTAFGVTLDPRSVAHDVSHIIDDYKEHEAYRKFKYGGGDERSDERSNERRNKERRSTGTTGLINDANRETLAALANEYIGLTQVCASLPDIKVKMPDNDEILTDFWVSSGIFGSLRNVRRRMFSRQDSLHELFGSYIENLSKNKEGIEKNYPPVLPVTDPRRGGGVGQDPFLQSIVGSEFISLQNIDRTRGQLMVSDDTYQIKDEEDEAYDSIIDLFKKSGGKIGRRTPENKVDLTKRDNGIFALEYVKRQQLLLIKNNREFLINIYLPSEEDKDWWDQGDSHLSISEEVISTLFFRENTQDELDIDEIMEQLGDEVDTSDPHFNLQDYLDELDIDELDLDLDFGSMVKVTEIGVCRAYQFYKVCDAYGQYSDYFAIEDPKNLLDNSIMRRELTEILRRWERMDGNAIGYVKWNDTQHGNPNRWNNTGIIDFVINNPGESQKFKRGFISNICGKIIIDINEIDRENIVNDIQEPIAKDQFIELLKSIEEPFLTQEGIDKSKKYLESLEDKYWSEDESKTRVERWGELSLETIFKHIDNLDMKQNFTLHDIIRNNYNPKIIEKIKKLNAINVKGLLYGNSPYVMCMVLGLSGKQTFEVIDEKLLKFYKKTWNGYVDEPKEDQIKFNPTEYSRQILKSIGEDEIIINSIDLFSGKNIKSNKLNIEFNLNDLQYPVNHGGQTNIENEYVIENTETGEFIRYISANSDTAHEKFGFSHYRDETGLEIKYYPFKSVVETNKPLFKYFMTIGFDLVGGQDYHDAMFGGDRSGNLQALMTKFKKRRKERPTVQAKTPGESTYEASSSTESGYREFVDGSFERRKQIIDKVHDIYSNIFNDIMTPDVVFDDNDGLVSLQILAGN